MADAIPTLSISTEKICFVVVKAREIDVKDADTTLDDGSNPTDDRLIEVLEDRPRGVYRSHERRRTGRSRHPDLARPRRWYPGRMGRAEGRGRAYAQQTHCILPPWSTPFARLFRRCSRGVRPFVRRV